MIQYLQSNILKKIQSSSVILFLICFLLVSQILVSCDTSKVVKPKVENGVINLTQWDFKKSGPVPLDGMWKFVWNQLISPGDQDTIFDFFDLPKNWQGKTKSGIGLSQEGFGTYSLTILLPEISQPVAFYLPRIGHACSIWINKKPVFQAGKVSDNRETMIAKDSRDIFFVDIHSTEIKMVMQVSNFVYRTGGIESSIVFGSKDQILQLRIKNVFFEAFLTGSLIFTAILHIIIAVLFTRRRAASLFAMICLNMALLNLVNGEHILDYLLPSLPWAVNFKLDYLTAFAFPLPLIASFIYNLFPHPRSKHFLTIIIGIGLLCGIFIVSSPVHTFSQFLFFFELLLILQSCYVAYLLIIALNNGLQGSGMLFAGGIVLLLTAISDMLFYEQYISIGPLVVVGFCFFLLSQAFAFAIQFMNNYNRLKRFSINLEWQVDERTRNLQQANQNLQNEIKNKEEIEEKLRTLSQTDPLTKINNRYKFNETLDEEIRRVNRYNGSLSAIMFDIDHFKMVNDTYGHDVGDRVLVNVAQLVENMIRDIDSFARWGGEEFVILTPNNDMGGATMLAERIRKTIELTDFTPVNTLTASFGVIEYVKDEEKTSFLKRVDEALYTAKYQGRNQVVSSENGF